MLITKPGTYPICNSCFEQWFDQDFNKEEVSFGFLHDECKLCFIPLSENKQYHTTNRTELNKAAIKRLLDPIEFKRKMGISIYKTSCTFIPRRICSPYLVPVDATDNLYCIENSNNSEVLNYRQTEPLPLKVIDGKNHIEPIFNKFELTSNAPFIENKMVLANTHYNVIEKQIKATEERVLLKLFHQVLTKYPEKVKTINKKDFDLIQVIDNLKLDDCSILVTESNCEYYYDNIEYSNRKYDFDWNTHLDAMPYKIGYCMRNEVLTMKGISNNSIYICKNETGITAIKDGYKLMENSSTPECINVEYEMANCLMTNDVLKIELVD